MECTYDCVCERCDMDMEDVVNDWLYSDDI